MAPYVTGAARRSKVWEGRGLERYGGSKSVPLLEQAVVPRASGGSESRGPAACARKVPHKNTERTSQLGGCAKNLDHIQAGHRLSASHRRRLQRTNIKCRVQRTGYREQGTGYKYKVQGTEHKHRAQYTVRCTRYKNQDAEHSSIVQGTENRVQRNKSAGYRM